MDTKSGSKTGSKTNLNESTLPLLEEQEGKGDVPEKIELETKNDNKDDEKKDQNETKDKKGCYYCYYYYFFFLFLITFQLFCLK
jgi:hypothetical protein